MCSYVVLFTVLLQICIVRVYYYVLCTFCDVQEYTIKEKCLNASKPSPSCHLKSAGEYLQRQTKTKMVPAKYDTEIFHISKS